MIDELTTMMAAALPIVELRGAIPMGMGVFGFSAPKAYMLSVVGNILPVLPLLWGLERFSGFLMQKNQLAGQFFNWLFIRTRRKFGSSFAVWGPLALATFVAVPLPMTGAWTGTVAAFLFGIPRWRAFSMISLGVITAGLIVAPVSLLGFSLF